MRPLPETRKILAIVILYRMQSSKSPTYRSLQRAASMLSADTGHLQILLHDNSPSGGRPAELPEQVMYLATENHGLSEAYNQAAAQARAAGYGWLLTLDQDTELPETFLMDLLEVVGEIENDTTTAAIVPHIRAGSRSVSPNWFWGGMLPRWFRQGYRGIPKQAVYAFNSGALIRVSALQEVGGYSPLFWLDYCDAYLFRRLELKGKKVYVAAHIELQHDFSMLDIQHKMSLERYRNALAAGSAFYDLEMGWLANLEHTGRLIGRLIKQRVQRKEKSLRQATWETLRGRLTHSRKERIASWTKAQRVRRQNLNGWTA